MAASATFALKAGVWFRRGRLLIVSPDSLGTACPLSGRNSTYRPVQISGIGSHYLCTIAEFCGAIDRFSGGAPPRGVRRRERNWNICGLRRQRRRGLGGPLDDAAFATRCGGAYQAGEPRAVAAAAR